MEFRIGPTNYRTVPMGAIPQWHIMRRIGAAATGDIIEVVNRIIDARRKSPKADAGENWLVGMMTSMEIVDLIPIIEPLIGAIGRMSDADSNYVLMGCMSCVQREAPGGRTWTPIVLNDQLMYVDIRLPEMLQIVCYVLRDNLTSFFGEPLTNGPQVTGAQNGPDFRAAKTG